MKKRSLKESLIILSNKYFFNFLSDKTYLKLKYRIIIGKKLNLDNPRTFNEKLQWLKLYDRNPEYVKMVDKYEVKKYISSLIGEKYIIPTLGIYEKFDDIDFEKLPNRFVIKCTHDSGGIIICKNKKEFDIKKARKKVNKCLKNNYYYKNREWSYKNVKPRIIIEKYMEDKETKDLYDYKIHCFNGKVKLVLVCSNRFSETGICITYFDTNWNLLPLTEGGHPIDATIKRPSNYDEMIEISEKLSKNIPFVRIDWYDINGKLYFGEFTFFTNAGYELFDPEEWDEKLGDYIQLPNKKVDD